jgi:hypothetical protein
MSAYSNFEDSSISRCDKLNSLNEEQWEGKSGASNGISYDLLQKVWHDWSCWRLASYVQVGLETLEKFTLLLYTAF